MQKSKKERGKSILKNRNSELFTTTDKIRYSKRESKIADVLNSIDGKVICPEEVEKERRISR